MTTATTHSLAFADAAAAMAAVDPSTTTATLARLDEEREQILGAIERTEAELTMIAEQRRSAVRSGPDRDAAADALLEGGDVEEALKGIDRLDERATALHAGLSGLRHRLDTNREARRVCKLEFGASFNEAGELIYVMLVQEARDLATALAKLFASATSAAASTNNGPVTYLAQRLGPAVAALSLRSANEAVLIEPGALRPDPALLDALNAGADALAVAGRAIHREIGMPTPSVDYMALAAGFRRGAARA